MYMQREIYNSTIPMTWRPSRKTFYAMCLFCACHAFALALTVASRCF